MREKIWLVDKIDSGMQGLDNGIRINITPNSYVIKFTGGSSYWEGLYFQIVFSLPENYDILIVVPIIKIDCLFSMKITKYSLYS